MVKIAQEYVRALTPSRTRALTRARAGGEDEDEWLEVDSDRLREQQDEPATGESTDAAGAPGAAIAEVSDAVGGEPHDILGGARGKGKLGERSHGADDDKTLKLLGAGWQKMARDKQGHYMYISPTGVRFNNLASAQEHAAQEHAAQGAQAGCASSKKKSREDRPGKHGGGGGRVGGGDGAGKGKKKKEKEEKAVEFAEVHQVRAKTARPLEKAYLREVDAAWHHVKYATVLAASKKMSAAAGKGVLEGIGSDKAMTEEEYVARVVACVQQSMDIHLGIHLGVSTPAHMRPDMPKIPHYLFRTFEEEDGGALLVILSTVAAYMREHNIKGLPELQEAILGETQRTHPANGPSPPKRKELGFAHMALLRGVRDALTEHGLFSAPVLYLSPGLEDSKGRKRVESIEEIRMWAQALDAQLVDSPEEATHIIVRDTDDMAETDENFCRCEQVLQ